MRESLFTSPAYEAGLEQLVVLARAAAVAFAAEARVLTDLAERTDRDGWRSPAPFESLLLDVAGTCVIGQRSAGQRLADAQHLVTCLRGTLARLDAGALGVPQARVLIAETSGLDEPACAQVERRVLLDAADLAPGPLRARVRRAVAAVDASDAARRAAQARTDRRVWVRQASEDGMALLFTLLPAEQVQQVMLSLSEQAHALRTSGDPRSTDQLRADLLFELLTGRRTLPDHPTPRPAAGSAAPPEQERPGQEPPATPRTVVVVRAPQVVVHVPLATALGVSDEPGELDGVGPLCAAQVRQLLVTAELRALYVDARTGRPLTSTSQPLRRPQPTATPLTPVALRQLLQDLTLLPVTVPPDRPQARHDPSAALARFVRLRDRGCDGIGCSVPASRCELDHHIPWPDGPTTASNLRARSQRCHHAKHHGWTVTTRPDGSSHWTSPGGRAYQVPSRWHPPPALPPGAHLPDPDALAARDHQLLTPPPDDAGPASTG